MAKTRNFEAGKGNCHNGQFRPVRPAHEKKRETRFFRIVAAQIKGTPKGQKLLSQLLYKRLTPCIFYQIA